LNSYIRKKTINGREYFYEMTSYWDREKKKIRYHNRYLDVQKEKSIEKTWMHPHRNIFVYGPFIPVLQIIREMGIEKILDSVFWGRQEHYPGACSHPGQ